MPRVVASFEQKVKNITPRGMRTIAKALAYAIGAIDMLPPDKREASDRDEMLAILHFMCPNEEQRSLEADEVERHTGFRPDLETYLLGKCPSYPKSA